MSGKQRVNEMVQEIVDNLDQQTKLLNEYYDDFRHHRRIATETTTQESGGPVIVRIVTQRIKETQMSKSKSVGKILYPKIKHTIYKGPRGGYFYRKKRKDGKYYKVYLTDSECKICDRILAK